MRLPANKVSKLNPYAAYVKATYHRAEGESLAEKIKTIGASWRTLSSQDKAEWAAQKQPVVETRTVDVVPPTNPPRAVRAAAAAPRRIRQVQSLNAYSAYTKAIYHEMEGRSLTEKSKKIGAQWRTLSPQEKAEWAARARPDVRNCNTEVVPPKNRLTAMSLYVKAMMSKAPEGTTQNKMRFIGAQWVSLPSEEKAVWARKAAEIVPQKKPGAPKLRNGYHVFLHDRLRETGGRISHVTGEWKAMRSDVKDQYARRAAEWNASQADRRGRFNAMSLYVKTTMADTPKGTPQERMRHVAAQWTALTTEEKAVWALKAAEAPKKAL